jgi:uncharacterized Fe-S center protein
VRRGCGARLAALPEGPADLEWEKMPIFIERIFEYAFGAVSGKDGRSVSSTSSSTSPRNVTDLPRSDAPIVPDVGISASEDPVVIDAASFELVNDQQGLAGSALQSHSGKGGDKFRGLWSKVDGSRQLSQGEEMGLGSSRYRMIDI